MAARRVHRAEPHRWEPVAGPSERLVLGIPERAEPSAERPVEARAKGAPAGLPARRTRVAPHREARAEPLPS